MISERVRNRFRPLASRDFVQSVDNLRGQREIDPLFPCHTVCTYSISDKSNPILTGY